VAAVVPRPPLPPSPPRAPSLYASVRVEQVLVRVHVDDLDAALPLYEGLADRAPVRRFAFRAVELAWVCPLLLLAGSPDDLAPFRDRAAAVLVANLEAVAAEVTGAGAELLKGPAPFRPARD
jgi:hypothetical protein